MKVAGDWREEAFRLTAFAGKQAKFCGVFLLVFRLEFLLNTS
jgi:hypothetical protein